MRSKRSAHGFIAGWPFAYTACCLVELHRSILCAQQMLLSEVLPTSDWIARL